MAVAAGTRLGPYEVVAPLGAGGMGEVYRARDTKLDRDVAIKVLPEELASDEERVARFEREAKLLASLNHPNIAGIYGFEENAIVLELVEGPTLAERIEQGPIPVDEAIAIAKQIAEALEAGHEAGVIHRDLKPANIKVREDGTVKVLDYGLAKALEGDAATEADSELSQSPTLTRQGTQIGVILGTAAYMSPEQARGKPVDERTDIWAFGAVVYEMLTAEKAFPGEDVSDTLAGVLRAEPDLDSLPRATPVRLRRVLRLCLEKDARARFSAAHDIGLLLSGTVYDDEPPAVAEPRRSSGWVLGLVGAVAGIVVGLVVRDLALPDDSTVASVRKFDLPMDTRGNLLDGPAISPDGTMIAYADRGQLWIRRLDDTVPRRVAGSLGASHPTWAPDSMRLAYLVEQTLWSVTVDGDDLTELVRLPGNYFLGGVWTTDDTIVLSISDYQPNTGTLYAVSARDGEITLLREASSDAGEQGVRSPILLDDGRGLLFTVDGEDGAIRLKHLRDGTEKYLSFERTPAGIRRSTMALSPSGHLLYMTDRGLMAQSFSFDRIDVEGERFLVDPNGSYPSVSRDGTLVYKRPSGTAGKQQFAWVGRDQSVLETRISTDLSIMAVALSPSGDRIAFAENDVFIHNVARGVTERFTFGDGMNLYPAWSPDGARMLYSTLRDAPFRFFIRDADGGGEPVPLESGPFNAWNPHWSHRGDYIVYHVLGEATQLRDIWYIEMNGDRTPQVFLETAANEGAPHLSPDGRFLAYQSDESGRLEIYVRPFPSGDGIWQVSQNGGHHPRWSPDGMELFYAERGTLMAVNVATQPTFNREAPRALVDSEDAGFLLDCTPWTLFNPLIYDVSPDGERFLVVQNVGGGSEAMTVVENWATELDSAFVAR